MKGTAKNENSGNLKISHKAIEEIAAHTVSEIEGVASLAPHPLSVKEMLLKSVVDKPFKITLNGEMASIDISVNLKSGYKIKRVCEEVQEKVKEAVQSMTGVAVAKVNVYAAGVLSV